MRGLYLIVLAVILGLCGCKSEKTGTAQFMSQITNIVSVLKSGSQAPALATKSVYHFYLVYGTWPENYSNLTAFAVEENESTNLTCFDNMSFEVKTNGDCGVTMTIMGHDISTRLTPIPGDGVVNKTKAPVNLDVIYISGLSDSVTLNPDVYMTNNRAPGKSSIESVVASAGGEKIGEFHRADLPNGRGRYGKLIGYAVFDDGIYPMPFRHFAWDSEPNSEELKRVLLEERAHSTN